MWNQHTSFVPLSDDESIRPAKIQEVENIPQPRMVDPGRRTCGYLHMGPIKCSTLYALQILFVSPYLAQKQRWRRSTALPSLFASSWKSGKQNLPWPTGCHRGFIPRNKFFILHGKLLKWRFLGSIIYKHKYGSSNAIPSFHSCICAKLKKIEKQRERKKNDPRLLQQNGGTGEKLFP